MSHETMNDTLHQDAAGRIIGRDGRMMRVFELVEAVADSRATVLLTGESGTGKSLIARAIHQRSRRRERPFVEVCCGALPETLLESELFGHVRGAFTDAHAERTGKFVSADGGTIFLDEISAASPAFQLKLLRVLQDRVVEPVGSDRAQTVDVRVILASNRELREEVEAGRFRRDLFYRVNVVMVELPPLRDRPGDIPLLAQHFLERFQRENDRILAGVSDLAMQALLAYRWPGNVRELENCIERAVVLCRTGRIGLEDLPREVAATAGPEAMLAELAGGPHAAPAEGRALGATAAPFAAVPPVPPLPPMPWAADSPGVPSAVGCALLPGQSLQQALAEPERQIILHALALCGGNRTAAARLLGINRATLYKKMHKHGLWGGV